MNNSFLQNHHPDFPNSLDTLMVLSARKDPNATSTQNCFLSSTKNTANLQAIDFDGIRQKWYPYHRQAPQPNNVPCSVDALLFERKGTYLIEFKSGHVEKANLIRKIYDSIMMLIEKDNFTFDKSRKECTYIVVSNIFKPWDKRTKALAYSLAGKKNPWKELIKRLNYDQLELEKLEDVLVSSSYVMSSELFELFIKFEKWK